jgi:hypothetical protein
MFIGFIIDEHTSQTNAQPFVLAEMALHCGVHILITSNSTLQCMTPLFELGVATSSSCSGAL